MMDLGGIGGVGNGDGNSIGRMSENVSCRFSNVSLKRLPSGCGTLTLNTF